MFSHARFPFLAAAVALALSAPANVKGQMPAVYDNGSPNLLNGFEITHWKEANPFTLTDAVALAGVRFWDVEAAAASFQSQVYWEIRSDNNGLPGLVLFSGT